MIADVKTAIIGADFLRHYGLLVDMRHRCLSDSLTHLQVNGVKTPETTFGLTLLPTQPQTVFTALLKEFPSAVQPNN